MSEDKARRAEKKAASRQFWGDILSVVGQVATEYTEQQRNTNSSSSSSSYSYEEEVIEEDDSPNFNSIELETGGYSGNTGQESKKWRKYWLDCTLPGVDGKDVIDYQYAYSVEEAIKTFMDIQIGYQCKAATTNQIRK